MSFLSVKALHKHLLIFMNLHQQTENFSKKYFNLLLSTLATHPQLHLLNHNRMLFKLSRRHRAGNVRTTAKNICTQ
jgi:hypothetical protein